MNNETDKFLGCIFGLALGDAISAPYQVDLVQNMTKLFTLNKENYKKHQDHDLGQYTSKTILTLSIIENIISEKGINLSKILNDFADLYNENQLLGDLYATETAVKNYLKENKVSKAAAVVGKADNSTITRTAPIALWHINDKDKKLIKSAVMLSELTHKDYRTTCGAVAVSKIIQFLVNTKPPLKFNVMLKQTTDLIKTMDKKFAKHIYDITNYRSKNIEIAELKLKKAGNEKYSQYAYGGGVTPYVLSTLLISLYHFLRNTDDFFKMLEDLIKCGGAVNDICALAGCFWGSLNGYNKLPLNFVEGLKDKEKIYKLTVQFYKTKFKIK